MVQGHITVFNKLNGKPLHLPGYSALGTILRKKSLEVLK